MNIIFSFLEPIHIAYYESVCKRWKDGCFPKYWRERGEKLLPPPNNKIPINNSWKWTVLSAVILIKEMPKKKAIGFLDYGHSSYRGDFDRGDLNGYGIFVHKKGVIVYYQGEFVDGKPHGKGKARYSDGTEFEGNFASGERHGNGIFTHSNGKKESNIFVEERSCLDIFLCGMQKVSYIIEEKRNDGTMRIRYTNGQIYEGEFVKGKKEGKGRLEEITGDICIGSFKEDLVDGDAIIYKSNCVKVTGKFSKGVLVGTVISEHPDGTIVECDMDSTKIPITTISYRDGKSFIGQLRFGEKTGNGTLDTKKFLITGDWSEGRIYGNFHLHLKDYSIDINGTKSSEVDIDTVIQATVKYGNSKMEASVVIDKGKREGRCRLYPDRTNDFNFPSKWKDDNPITCDERIPLDEYKKMDYFRGSMLPDLHKKLF